MKNNVWQQKEKQREEKEKQRRRRNKTKAEIMRQKISKIKRDQIKTKQIKKTLPDFNKTTDKRFFVVNIFEVFCFISHKNRIVSKIFLKKKNTEHFIR